MRSPPGSIRLTTAAVALCLMATGACAQSVSSTAALSFGSFTAGSGGTITIGAGGSRMKTGTIILVNQGGSAAAAQFNVTGTPSAVFTISLPVDGTVMLSDGSNTLALNGFVSSPASVGTLSGGGSQLISVGATMTVGPNQAPGNYSGAFSVTVNYQ